MINMIRVMANGGVEGNEKPLSLGFLLTLAYIHHTMSSTSVFSAGEIHPTCYHT